MWAANPHRDMTHIKTASLSWVFAVLLSAAGVQAQTGPQPKLPTLPLTAGMHVIQAEIAKDPAQQMVGMMFRREMGANEGMLFVNDEAGMRCFWMRNTLIPLSIAFIADDGSIVNIADMAPQSEQSHCSTKPVRFALEMRQGWFAKHGLKAGFQLSGAPFRK
jgi:uncharacterized protein